MAAHMKTELPRHMINGEEVSRVCSFADAATVELVRRRPNGPVRWKLRQSRPLLIWSRGAIERQVLEVDGEAAVQKMRTLGSRLYVIPSYATFTGEIDVKQEFEYTMVFLDETRLGCSKWECLERFFEGTVTPEITRCLAALTREVMSPDNLFDMLSQSWLVQALALLTRMTGGALKSPAVRYRGGLSTPDRRRVEGYIQAHLGDPIKVSELAAQVDLGDRHFSRVFAESFNETPVAYVIRLRMEKAKRLLATTGLSMTEVALECGFSHAQHFSTRFHGSVGLSPSQFRRLSAS